jgi:hypothetical protein
MILRVALLSIDYILLCLSYFTFILLGTGSIRPIVEAIIDVCALIIGLGLILGCLVVLFLR